MVKVLGQNGIFIESHWPPPWLTDFLRETLNVHFRILSFVFFDAIFSLCGMKGLLYLHFMVSLVSNSSGSKHSLVCFLRCFTIHLIVFFSVKQHWVDCLIISWLEWLRTHIMLITAIFFFFFWTATTYLVSHSFSFHLSPFVPPSVFPSLLACSHCDPRIYF